MGKTVRFNQAFKDGQSGPTPLRSSKKSVRKGKKVLLDQNLSSRKAHGKIKQRVWPLGSENKKGHKI